MYEKDKSPPYGGDFCIGAKVLELRGEIKYVSLWKTSFFIILPKSGSRSSNRKTAFFC